MTQRHRQYLVRLPSATADAVDSLAAVSRQPKSAVVSAAVQAGLSTLTARRRICTPRQWRGALVEHRAWQQSK